MLRVCAIFTEAETNPDSIEYEAKPGNWNEYRVPSNTTGHLIMLKSHWLLFVIEAKAHHFEIIVSKFGWYKAVTAAIFKNRFVPWLSGGLHPEQVQLRLGLLQSNG